MHTKQLPQVAEEEEYYQFLSSLPTAIAVAYFDTGIIKYVNPLAEQLFAREQQQLIGKHQSIIHPPLTSETPNTFLQHQKILEQEGRIESIENSILRPDGSTLHVEITTNLIMIGGERYMVGVFSNTEKRFQAQQALQRKSNEFAALFENSQIGIMLLKEDQILHLANQHLADIFGYPSADAMFGISMRELHLSENHFETFGIENYQTLSYHKNMHIEYPLRKKNGDTVWCRISGKALDKNTPANLAKGVIWVVDDISDIKTAQEAIQQERDLFKNGPTVVIQWRAEKNWPVDFVSANIVNVLGYTQYELLNNAQFGFYDLLHPDDKERVIQEAKQHFSEQTTNFEQSYQIRSKSGNYRYIYDFNQVVYDAQGAVKSWYGYLQDMTDYLQAQEISTLLLNSTSEGIFGIDKNGTTTFINPAGAKMLGYREEDLIGHPNHALIHHSKESGEPIPTHQCRMMLPIKTGNDEFVSDEVLWRKDGSNFPVEYRSTPIFRKNDIIGTVVTFHDISYRREQEQKIQHLAFHDELTGLPNRRLFNDRLEEELKREKRTSNRAMLMMLDVDHFKDINDTFGHPIGDHLLKEITHRIIEVLRDSDTFARLGGDEFGILITHETSGVEAVQIAERILELFKTPFEIQDIQISVSTSIGIVFCEPIFSKEEVVTQADIALYQAKDSGRNNYVFYESEMSNRVKHEVQILSELNQAISEKSFQIFYQPKIDTLSERVVGLEALIRWFPQSEQAQSMSSPAVFIPIAESRGLIREITLWQVGQLVQDIQTLQENGFHDRVSINISGELLSHIENLVEFLEVIEHSELSFEQLDFEITETAYSKMSASVSAILESAQSNGLALSIDDFGTGYSSLISLRQFQANHLKIDKAFIDEIHRKKDDFAIVSATILMAHGLGKKVIAEGVETEQQFRALRRLKCDFIQGYYFAKPMPLQEICEFIK
ncbi:EAL domain-containing protein [Thiomicrorhabdus sp. 6S2-11]|uniref:EAL domain-containing protein n=1 Tax=Thiomicrorhabdus marina TaxID=2818442 RepID=A0ABS3Q5M8_9GAMM|nr:EAL domain-containing protein [Thiomicrorhabdus marina]MBO1927619.1 EAL domain-containing protein [Thiomicrorhabdus marina]